MRPFVQGVCKNGEEPGAHSHIVLLGVILCTFRLRGEGEVVRDKEVCTVINNGILSWIQTSNCQITDLALYF